MLNTRTKSTTARTCLRGIGRINILYCYPLFQGLVFNKRLELSEGPAMEVSPLGLASLGPLSYVGQLLHHNYITCLRAIYDHSANTMIQVAHNASLFAPKAFQELLSSECPFGLKTSAQLTIVSPNMHCLFPAKSKTIRSNRQIHHADVNPNVLARLGGRINLFLYNDMDVEGLGLLIVDEISSPIDLPVAQKRLLEPTENHWNLDTSLDRGDGSSAIFGNGEGSTIKSDRCIGAKLTGRMPIAPLVGFCNSISRCTGKLCRKTKLLSGIIIAKMVKYNFVRQTMMLKGYFGDVVAGIAKLTNGFKHCLPFFISRVQLALHGLCQVRHDNLSIHHIGGKVKGYAFGDFSSPQQATGFPKSKFL